MSECYICGEYISPGEGHRRQVKTGSSVSIYSGRSYGSSYRESYGLRTLCSTCSKIKDRQEEGKAVRAFLSLIAYIACCYIALQLPSSDISQPTKFLLFLFLITGCPVFIIGSILESVRRKQIIEEVFTEPINYASNTLQKPVRNAKTEIATIPTGVDDKDVDVLYEQVLAFVIQSRAASISRVQRRFKIGYNRAARIIEDMETEGIVSPPDANGVRTVLVPPLEEND